ncbi:MAG: ABC transporter ATP-binding protein [Firmicutes bacterium]|uniref:ABC transporter ATP-binding protein n=1 Tax=Candidatus Alloenteromonas pullistercoris TaxID=2840785 RepID=A0A9D9GWH8_9FIRM|nr:ABC transporter ATP-binding protein [Candidatus Enteromonas pullistercoris]
MGSLTKTMKQMVKGSGAVYGLTFLFQFFAVFMSVFSTFLIKVLVDAFSKTLDEASLLEVWVIGLLSGGNGASYLYAHMWVLPIAIVCSAFLAFFLSMARGLCRFRASSNINKKMQLTLFEHLERQPFAYYKKAKSGDLIQTCTRDVDVFRRFVMMDMNQFAYTFFIVALCVGILFSTSWKLTAVALCDLPLMFVYSFFLIKEVRKRYRATDDSEASMTEKISENLNAVRIVKAYNAEIKEMEAFEGKLSDYEGKFRRWRVFSSFFFASSDIFIFLSRNIALIYSLYLAVEGEITPGTVAIAFMFVNMMVWPLRSTATSLSNLGQVIASADRMQLLLSSPIEDVDSGIKPDIKGDIEFDGVSFSYPDEPERKVLDGVSFKLKAGQTLAILGKTGSGKSTLSQLLTRLYEPTSGTIRIDGTDIAEIAKSHLRHNVVPVLQDPFLFSKTIIENIRLAKQGASEDEVRHAAYLASVEEAIESFPKGYLTPVGEKGVTLSGGQKQRVAIARTILSGAPILIFDDSLSAVDVATDFEIRKHLKELSSRITTILITHRIASAKDADLILVLADGKVEEMGTHEQLLKRDGMYRRIADIQERIS